MNYLLYDDNSVIDCDEFSKGSRRRFKKRPKYMNSVLNLRKFTLKKRANLDLVKSEKEEKTPDFKMDEKVKQKLVSRMLNFSIDRAKGKRTL